MRIISIDPGYERLGIAIIEKEKGSKEKYLFSVCFHTPKTLSHSERLALIMKELENIIQIWNPKILAIETLFLTTNHKTAMSVAEARGLILGVCSKHGLKVFEFSPPQIKLAICGNGAADKKAIIKMIPLLIQIPKTIKIDDEFDALAIGITFFALHNHLL